MRDYVKKNFLVVSCVMLILASACVNNERAHPPEKNNGDFYFDYTVIGDEENNEVTVKLQYRTGGPGGRTWLIPEPGKVELDGELMVADSSRRNGYWYEANRLLDEFEGQHQIVFENNGKTFTEVFDFNRMSLKTEVPHVIYRHDLVFEFDGLSDGDQVRVLVTDTGFYSRGIDRIDTVTAGVIMISGYDLDNVKDGPVTIEFYRETEEELTETTVKGGRLLKVFGLRREFELKDSSGRPPGARMNGR
jgi:hypothetical protein